MKHKRELKVWSEKNNKQWYHSSASITWLAVFLTMSAAIVTVNLLYQSFFFFIKNCSLRTHAMYLVINLITVDMFVGGFSHFSLFVTLLYLCNIVQFPHLTLELTLTTGFLFVWFPLTSLTNTAVISLDQIHSTIRPYTALRHRLIKKWVYGVTIAALVWVLHAMFIILILKNRMFNQSPIFSTSRGPAVFSSGSPGHPKTEIAFWRSIYYLEISIARKKLKIHGWMYHSSQFFEFFSLLTSMIEVGNGILTFHSSSHIWSSFAKMDCL